MYCVIVGDIIDSKKIDLDTLKETKARMEQILELVNEKYYKIIMADFGIVRGDAFEGVLYSQVEAVDIIQDLIRKFLEEVGVSLRISCVTDELTIDEFDRNKSDGPAFHKAIEEIEFLKAKNSKHWLQISIVTKTNNQILMDTIADLLSMITSGWTEKQRKIAFAMSVYNQQKYVSKELGISPSVVNKQLKAINYQTYQNSWIQLKKYLEMIEDEKARTDKSDFTSLYSIGARKNNQQKYIEAKEYLNRALEIAKRTYGNEDIRLIPIYNELVRSYAEVSDFELAKKAIYISTCIQTETPSDARKYFQTLNAHGALLIRMDDVQNALKYFLEAEGLVREFWGRNSYNLYICYNNIAASYLMLNDYEHAKKYCELCLSETKKNKDMNIEGYIQACKVMGIICNKIGNESDSEFWLEEADELTRIS